MNGITGGELLTVMFANGVVLLVAAVVAGSLWDRRKGLAVLILIAMAFPPFFGLGFLYEESSSPTDCTLLCSDSPAFMAHWVGWVIGWVLCLMVLVPTGITLLVGKIRGRSGAELVE
ncbi:MAG: hypothetical protein AB7N24_02120 [Dehalococcoidia bacterium]